MTSNIKDFAKDFIPVFESSVEDINQSFRENLQNDLKYVKNNNLSEEELYVKIFSSTVSTLYGKSMQMSIKAIESYHKWLLEHYELKSKD